MIIVKITALSIIITVFYVWAIRVWADANPGKALYGQITGEYPILVSIIVLPIFVDIVGVFASAIWFLFFYL